MFQISVIRICLAYSLASYIFVVNLGVGLIIRRKPQLSLGKEIIERNRYE